MVYRLGEDWTRAYACGKEAVAIFRGIPNVEQDTRTLDGLRNAGFE